MLLSSPASSTSTKSSTNTLFSALFLLLTPPEEFEFFCPNENNRSVSMLPLLLLPLEFAALLLLVGYGLEWYGVG